MALKRQITLALFASLIALIAIPATAQVTTARFQIEAYGFSIPLAGHWVDREPQQIAPQPFFGRPRGYVRGGGSLRSQVVIESRFLTVSDNFFKDVGVDFDFDSTPPLTNREITAQNSTPSTQPGADITWGAGFSLSYRSLDDINLGLMLRAAEKIDRTETLSAPRITTFNNQRAQIGVLDQIGYIQDFDIKLPADAYSSTDTTAAVLRNTITLDVRPVVSADTRYITMQLQPTVVQLVEPLNVYSNAPLSDSSQPITFDLPKLGVRSVGTKLILPNRGTLVLGGLQFDSERETDAKVPILSDIPLIGVMFRNRTTARDKRELLITITPHIETDADDQGGGDPAPQPPTTGTATDRTRAYAAAEQQRLIRLAAQADARAAMQPDAGFDVVATRLSKLARHRAPAGSRDLAVRLLLADPQFVQKLGNVDDAQFTIDLGRIDAPDALVAADLGRPMTASMDALITAAVHLSDVMHAPIPEL